MFKDAEALIQQGLQLLPEERLRVAEQLFESIPEDEIAGAWLDEVDRRKSAWDTGLVTGVDGDEVIKGLRERAK